MDKEKIHTKLTKILDIDPELRQIMVSPATIPEKRRKIRTTLSSRLDSIFDGDTKIPPLEWILVRDSIRVFQSIMAKRSEQFAGFSFLQYIDDLLNNSGKKDLEPPSPGFFSEFEHLLKGITGKTGIYNLNIPAFLKHKGRKAAKLRSADLSRMAATAQKFLNRYPSGLERGIQRRRILNKQRILNYFGTTELEWEDWRWHTKNIIRDADTLKSLIKLTDEEYEALNSLVNFKSRSGSPLITCRLWTTSPVKDWTML